jgi:hypothetical protein
MKIPQYIRDWAEAVYKIASAQQVTLVVLGRDAWPVVAWLRSQGKPCQYFLCSRLQAESNDPSTKERWIVEVPPGAFVVDTGFRGSIIEWLRTCVDPTIIGGALMAASSGAAVYQVGRGEHDKVVTEIEHLPKHHDRTIGYNTDGYAITSVDEPWNNDGAPVDADNAQYTAYLLLREMGLTAEQTAQYAVFTGLTPEERIGVAHHGLVREHMLQVRQLRRERDNFAVSNFLMHGRPEEVERIMRTFGGECWAARYEINDAYGHAMELVERCRHDLEITPAWDAELLEDRYQRLFRWQRRLRVASQLAVDTWAGWHREMEE